MKFSGKMCPMITLKFTISESFTLSLEDTFFEKPQGGRGGGQIDFPPTSRFGIIVNILGKLGKVENGWEMQMQVKST